MRITVLYQSNTEGERPVTEFAREYERRTGRQLDLLDVNTRDGANMATMYDIVRYPAVLALTDDGRMQQMWTEETLPLMNEVLYYSPAVNG
jgi:hypothetical protein